MPNAVAAAGGWGGGAPRLVIGVAVAAAAAVVGVAGAAVEPPPGAGAAVTGTESLFQEPPCLGRHVRQPQYLQLWPELLTQPGYFISSLAFNTICCSLKILLLRGEKYTNLCIMSYKSFLLVKLFLIFFFTLLFLASQVEKNEFL